MTNRICHSKVVKKQNTVVSPSEVPPETVLKGQSPSGRKRGSTRKTLA